MNFNSLEFRGDLNSNFSEETRKINFCEEFAAYKADYLSIFILNQFLFSAEKARFLFTLYESVKSIGVWLKLSIPTIRISLFARFLKLICKLSVDFWEPVDARKPSNCFKTTTQIHTLYFPKFQKKRKMEK